MWHWSRRERAMWETSAADEAVAIVEGRIPEFSLDSLVVPRWGWINKLAHASWDDLANFAKKRPATNSSWEAAASYLAAELISRAENPQTLRALQRCGLVPLELSVFAGTTSTPTTPAGMVELVEIVSDRAKHFLEADQSG
jgi:hypothetical protein